MRWFRLYAELIHDPKVQKLPATTFREWINILCVACDHDGVVPDDRDVAFALRVSPMVARNMLIRLRDHGLLDQDAKGVLRPHNWDNRQFKHDLSTERVRRFRDKKRDETVSETVSRNERNTVSETAKVTVSKPPRARDTDTEQIQNPLTPLQGDEISNGVFERFVESFVGPVESDLWKTFPRWVHSESDAEAVVKNTSLWMQTDRYRTGFHSATSFLRSGVWKTPPKPSLIHRNGTSEEIDYPQ